MALIEWYPGLKQAHIGLVAVSGTLFAARAAGVLSAASWPMRPAVRHASEAIDTALLAAGVTLWIILGVDLAQAPWLASKLVLLVAYIVLGSFALKRAPTRAARAGFAVLALAVLGTMVSVATSKHPLGWVAPLLP